MLDLFKEKLIKEFDIRVQDRTDNIIRPGEWLEWLKLAYDKTLEGWNDRDIVILNGNDERLTFRGDTILCNQYEADWFCGTPDANGKHFKQEKINTQILNDDFITFPMYVQSGGVKSYKLTDKGKEVAEQLKSE